MNPLQYVRPERAVVIDEFTVAVFIDMTKNVHLRSSSVVEAGMNEYLDKFEGRMSRWAAQAEGDILCITVYGTINWPNRVDINL